MKIKSVNITIGIDTLLSWFKKKEKKKLRVGDLLEIKGFFYRVYDVDDEDFKAHLEKE